MPLINKIQDILENARSHDEILKEGKGSVRLAPVNLTTGERSDDLGLVNLDIYMSPREDLYYIKVII